MAEFDDENAADVFVGTPSYMRPSARGRSRPRWSSTEVPLRHPPPTAAAIDGFSDRYFNRLRVEDTVTESDILPEAVTETNEPEEYDDAVTPTDWRVS